MDTEYVYEKMCDAVYCLCGGGGTFGERLADATVSALGRLEVKDLDGELSEDLRFILHWTKKNINNGMVIRVPNDLERAKIIEKILHILLETHRLRLLGNAVIDEKLLESEGN